MISSLVRFVRPAAVGAAVVLVLGGVETSPAAAEPTNPPVTSLSLTSHAGYPPPNVVGGGPGTTRDWPAYVGPVFVGTVPAVLNLVVDVVNTGTEPLRDVSVSTRVVTNGQVVDGLRCSTAPRGPNDPRRAQDTQARRAGPAASKSRRVPSRQASAPQPSPVQPSSAQPSPAQPSARGATSVSWTDPALVLAPGKTLYCSAVVSGFEVSVVHEDITSAVAAGVDTGRRAVSDDAHVWATASAAAPPPPGPASVGDLVWLDSNSNGRQDEGEPGIPGVRVTIKVWGTGLPVTDAETGRVVGPQTTDKNGAYHFRHLPLWEIYDVIVDLSSPVLAELRQASDRSIYSFYDPVHSAWTIRARIYEEDLVDVDFGFEPKERVVATIDAPTTAVAGTAITVKGHADQPGLGFAWSGPAELEFRAGGTTNWTKVADASSYWGGWTVKVTATRSGSFRYRTRGDSYAASAVSAEDHVLVRTAPVALTAHAPTSVAQGTPLIVTGTITRAGTPFQTGRTTLEYSPDASTWTTVADVRSTDGTLTAEVPARAGSYRYRYPGDSKTAPGTSAVRQVVINPTTRTSPRREPPR